MPAISSLSLQGVHFSIRGRKILNDLTFTAQPGEFLAIVGPNGCGKSTTLRLMSGLARPDSGKILAGDTDLATLGRKEISRRIALLTQAGHVPPNLTVHDLVSMGRFAHQSLLSRQSREDEALVADALLSMHVQSLQTQRVGELSGGQLQRARMAMTLAQDGGILLLDEPTTYLDLRFQFGILEKARELAHAGRTVIAVLHDFTQASLFADRVAVMNEGRLVALGRPHEVLTEDIVAEVFGVRTKVVHANGAVFHVPETIAK
ncbi:MAG: ABC transporter ATP-binding protein [Candidatus Devosia phytovorans]|uniref:ABC transporter ATP-binding protein n=1 Tax=Candidatus Devosia phytovorans TaxID=3121372 RepID=A0AAJ6AZ71_9HYPH|nr:ABC transporter ATP-binding protein [Devosia sp.]WEK02889.1 MAG: ABC transporter ATP-binding protein [Devosia sp.]